MKILETKRDIQKELKKFLKPGKSKKLALINLGAEISSYIKYKIAVCEEFNISVEKFFFRNLSEKSLIELIVKLNHDPQIDGILVQLPLPQGFDVFKVLSTIALNKDVDKLNPQNLTNLTYQVSQTAPSPTILSFEALIKEHQISLYQKKIVLLGYGYLVGINLLPLLIHAGAIVTVFTKDNPDGKKHTLKADMVIVCTGQKNLVQPHMLNPDAIVIDFGCGKDAANNYYGEVERHGLQVKAINAITKSLGPLTIFYLVRNILELP